MQLSIIIKNGKVEDPIHTARLRQWPRGITIRVHHTTGITEFYDDVEKCNLLISMVNGEWQNQLGAGAESVMTKWHRQGVLRRTAKGAFYLNNALYYQVELHSAAFLERPHPVDLTQKESDWLVALVMKKPETRTLEEEIMNACTYPAFGPLGARCITGSSLVLNGPNAG